MDNLNQLIDTLNKYAQIADSIGDYKTADKCYELLKEAENFNNSNIRTAAIREAFFRKLFRGIKNIGKAIDRGVRKIVPGGWGTVLGLVGAPFLAKLPLNLKGLGGQVLNFVKGGGDPMTLLNNASPEVRQLAQDFISQSKQAGQQQAATTPQTGSQQQTYQQQAAMGMQSGASPFMSNFLGLQGNQQAQVQPSLEMFASNNYNSTANQLDQRHLKLLQQLFNNIWLTMRVLLIKQINNLLLLQV